MKICIGRPTGVNLLIFRLGPGNQVIQLLVYPNQTKTACQVTQAISF